MNCTEISDSDDEVLGLDDTPVSIRPFQRQLPSPVFTTHSKPSGSNDWTVYKGRGMRKRQHCGNATFRPTMLESGKSNMEIIDVSHINVIGCDAPKKYRRMKDTPDVRGFVVNVHDATNFDIDLHVSADTHERYREVISNHYTYKDMPPDYYTAPDLAKVMAMVPKVGTTYRCRLKGIGINSNTDTWKATKIFCEVINLFNRSDHWITCTLSDIDVYERLLVEIYVHTASGVVNLCDYLLGLCKDDPKPLFSPYIGKKDRSSRK